MSRIQIVGEDALCCALGERLVKTFLPHSWKMARPINTRGVTNLWKNIRRYHDFAQNLFPVLCIADTDNQCVGEILRHRLPEPCGARFLLRLAVTEAESWLLADQKGFAQAFSIPLDKLPQAPDMEVDPKRLLLTLAAKSKVRSQVVQKDRLGKLKPGAEYNACFCTFVRAKWNARQAAQNSPSLARAIERLKTLRQQNQA